MKIIIYPIFGLIFIKYEYNILYYIIFLYNGQQLTVEFFEVVLMKYF